MYLLLTLTLLLGASVINPPVALTVTVVPITVGVTTAVVATKLPPLTLADDVMLPVAVIKPPVIKLPPVTLPLALTIVPVIVGAVTVVVAITLPPATLAELVMLPVAVINPPVIKLPPVTLPLALTVTP